MPGSFHRILDLLLSYDPTGRGNLCLALRPRLFILWHRGKLEMQQYWTADLFCATWVLPDDRKALGVNCITIIIFQRNIWSSWSIKDVERSYSVLHNQSLGPDRTDCGSRSQRPIKTTYFKNFKLMISHHPVIVERRNTAHWIRYDETSRMVVITYF